MIDNELEQKHNGWLWQDIVSTYRFWGLVLAAFLMSISKSLSDSKYFDIIFAIYYDSAPAIKFGELGVLIAGLTTLYFLRKRIKAALVLFALISVISLYFLYFGYMTKPAVVLAVSAFKAIGRYGFLLAVLAALISARLPLKSFLIAFTIIWFWSYAGSEVGYKLSVWHSANLSYSPIDDAGTPPKMWLFFVRARCLVPAILAFLALVLLRREMFEGGANVTVAPAPFPTPNRSPVSVSVLSFIVPFYFLFWLYKRPGELKTLAPSMHQPSAVGAVCIGVFAPMVLPIWFHDVRKGSGGEIKNRSAGRIGVAGFFLPPIAAGMAQSDYNTLANHDE